MAQNKKMQEAFFLLERRLILQTVADALGHTPESVKQTALAAFIVIGIFGGIIGLFDRSPEEPLPEAELEEKKPE